MTGRLHVSDATYESPYDSVHDLRKPFTTVKLIPNSIANRLCKKITRGILQRIVLAQSSTFYSILPHSTTFYHGLPRSTKFYRILLRSTTVFRVLPSSTAFYHVLPRPSAFYSDLPHSTTFYHDLPRSTAFYRTLPRSTTCLLLLLLTDRHRSSRNHAIISDYRYFCRVTLCCQLGQ
jgi:hypothetical protein